MEVIPLLNRGALSQATALAIAQPDPLPAA
jgi:hypothetical protein